jgi:cell division protein FtsZ
MPQATLTAVQETGIEEIQPPVENKVKAPRITVMGIGGAGNNAVANMMRSKLQGCDFVVANTDAQALEQSICTRRIQLGLSLTQGLGAGSKPEVGGAAAEEAMNEILQQIEGSNMLFVTAGMGGGTGTGAAPVIAKMAREKGILTVGVITKPFHFEGAHRMTTAEKGIAELQQYVDTLIIIPNQNLFRVANEKTTFADAFKMADDVLYSGVRSVTDLMIIPGLINLDFADIRTVMTEMGKAMMGTGEAEGENRAIQAAEAAISNPLLDDVCMRGANGVLISVTGGMDMTLFEVDEAANRIRDEVENDANIIFGSTFDESLNGRIRVSVVATGIDHSHVPKVVSNKFGVGRDEANSSLNSSVVSTDMNDLLGDDDLDINSQFEAGDDSWDLPEEEGNTQGQFSFDDVAERENTPSEFSRDFSSQDASSQDETFMRYPHEKSKKSFFQRLTKPFRSMGSSEDGMNPEIRTYSVSTQAETDGSLENGDHTNDISDVPAFLRRQGK